MIKYSKQIIIVGLFLLPLLNSCEKLRQNGGSGEVNNIIDIIEPYGDLSSFKKALEKSGILNAVKTTVPLTVFAPTNAAFNEFLAKYGFPAIDDVDPNALAPVLAYHMVNAGITSNLFANGYMATMCEGPDFQRIGLLMNSTTQVLNGQARITEKDIIASNGVIHIIDKVLKPPSVIELLRQNPALEQMVTALRKTKLDTLLTNPGPFTVFAPSDEAFDKFLQDEGVAGFDEIPEEKLLSIIKHHIGYGNLIVRYPVSKTIQMLNGTLTIETGYYFLVDNYVNIVGIDIQASNGIVQVIDQVLIPY